MTWDALITLTSPHEATGERVVLVVARVRAEMRREGRPIRAYLESGAKHLPDQLAVALTNECLRSLEDRIVALEKAQGGTAA